MAAFWGIDIGKAGLKAVKLNRSADGLEIQALEHLGYPVEEDEDERLEHQSEAIRAFLETHKIGSDTVAVAIPGLQAFSRFIKLPPVDKKKLAMMVRMEAQQQIPFPIDEVNWDYTILPEEPGEELEVGLFATRTELIDGFLDHLSENGLIPDVVTIAPLAVYNFVKANGLTGEGGTILLDIGAEHTDLVIVDGERFWIRNLRTAGNDITKALAERFKIPFAEAEKLKVSASKSDQAKKILGALESTLKDLVGEIHRSVGFFKSQSPDLSIKRMVLLGDGAKLKGAEKFFERQLKYPVKRVSRLDPEQFMLEEDVDVDTLKGHLLGFGVALGLAVQAAGQARCNVNLAPEQLQIQSQLKTKLPFAIATAACMWVALGLGYTHWTAQTADVQAILTKVKGLKKYERIQTEATEALAVLPPLEEKAKVYDTLAPGRTLMLDLIREVGSVLPTENGRIPTMSAAERSQDLKKQVVDYLNKLESEKTNESKLWMLDWSVRQKAVEGQAAPAYEVRMQVLATRRAVGAGKERPDQVRDRIKNDFVTKLTNRLSEEPFWVKSSAGYGAINVSPPKELYGLHPSKTFDEQVFYGVAVTLTFEVGVPKPEPKPEPAEQGEGEGEEE